MRIGNMENLPEKTNNAVVIRRSIPVEVVSRLNPIDRDIWVASTKKPISEYSPEELTNHVGKLSAMIAKDAGIKQIDAYSATRFVDILRKYYYTFSLSEIKTAFELGMTGQLDEYLPKDKNGHPDRHHYQSFSIDYVTKILNAYKRKFSDVETKVYTSLPAPKKVVTDREKQFYMNQFRESLRKTYIVYKYKGIIEERMNDLLVYNALERMGYAEPIKVTPVDMKCAVSRLINKQHKGVLNDFIGSCIRSMGVKHDSVPHEALILARIRAIRETFDYMIRNEINI